MATHLIAYDLVRDRPACVLIAAALGAEVSVAKLFPSERWLTDLTPDMEVYTITDAMLELVVLRNEWAVLP